MLPGKEVDEAEQQYEAAEQAYLAAVRRGASGVDLAPHAAKLQELAAAWAETERLYAAKAGTPADDSVPEVLEGLWAELRAAHEGAGPGTYATL